MKPRAKASTSDDDVETAPWDPHARAPVRMRATVTWTDEEDENVVALTDSRIVGSARDAGIAVIDRTVSRIHAELDPREDGVWVRDLGSKNGTFVQGVQVIEARVPDGAVVR